LALNVIEGVLITGAPGTGKTLLAKTFVGLTEGRFKLIEISGADLVQKVRHFTIRRLATRICGLSLLR
jgi:ATP-dependent 26S proteasome regulatory subunit